MAVFNLDEARAPVLTAFMKSLSPILRRSSWSFMRMAKSAKVYILPLFMADRSTMELVFVNECLEYGSTCKKGVVLKFKFGKKACDSVDWDLPDFALARKGIGNRWIKRVHGCPSTVIFCHD